jgi:protein-disulfide isomerase
MLIASGLGAAIAVAAFQWVGTRPSSDSVQMQILAELKDINVALRGGTPPSRPVQDAAPALPKPPADLRIAVSDSVSLGRADAKLVMVEFSDFDCPFCARYSADTKDRLIREYVDTGKVRYVFRHMPLKNLHPNAIRESEAAECARRQGRFWQIYPLLFTNKQPSTDAELRAHALAAGASAAEFDTCFAGQATATVMRDVEDGARAGIYGTPTFFVGALDANGRVQVDATIVGAQPIEKFRSVIDPLLSR